MSATPSSMIRTSGLDEAINMTLYKAFLVIFLSSSTICTIGIFIITYARHRFIPEIETQQYSVCALMNNVHFLIYLVYFTLLHFDTIPPIQRVLSLSLFFSRCVCNISFVCISLKKLHNFNNITCNEVKLSWLCSNIFTHFVFCSFTIIALAVLIVYSNSFYKKHLWMEIIFQCWSI